MKYEVELTETALLAIAKQLDHSRVCRCYGS